jgi:hypothetical protein
MRDETPEVSISETKQDPLVVDDIPPLPPSEDEGGEAFMAAPSVEAVSTSSDLQAPVSSQASENTKSPGPAKQDFVPARLPFFS